MTTQPDALPACPFCGGETYTRDEIIETNITEYGGNRYTYVALCKSCQSSGPTCNDLEEAIAAFTNPAHALATSRAEVERLRALLIAAAVVCCEECGGDGWVGRAQNGKQIACESCGGHEDALGLGAVLDPEFVRLRDAALAAQGGGT